jgi:hypothetical protein
MLFDVTVTAVDDCTGCEHGVDDDEVEAEVRVERMPLGVVG